MFYLLILWNIKVNRYDKESAIDEDRKEEFRYFLEESNIYHASFMLVF